VGKSEAAHNLQVTASNDKFMVQLELPGFAPEDFSLKTKDDVIVLEAVHDSKEEESTSRYLSFLSLHLIIYLYLTSSLEFRINLSPFLKYIVSEYVFTTIQMLPKKNFTCCFSAFV
jgi:hypothetical protein